MRCASIHRKLGTHVSKVKSLSMDTWTTEQVEVRVPSVWPSPQLRADIRQNMKRQGNTVANKVYNPKNKKPDMPLDADEIDSAMERFIRKKYQEKSLADGKPEPPLRDDVSPTAYSRSPDNSPPPPLPPKKGKFFGFGLRASSSMYPLSKHDKKKLPPEPQVDRAIRVTSDDYDGLSRTSDARKELSEAEYQSKLAALRDMGFHDLERNTAMLRRLNGNLERTVEALIRLGPSVNEKATSASVPTGPGQDTSRTTRTPASTNTGPSLNPFQQTSSGQTFGLSMEAPQQGQPAEMFHTSTPGTSTNPFDQPPRGQTDTGLEPSFQSLQLSKPLFPHSTGGYPSQAPLVHDPRSQYSMTPPVPVLSHQHGLVASPSAISVSNNPFFQNVQPPQPAGSNPFIAQVAGTTPLATPSTNPFFTSQPPPFDPAQSAQWQNPSFPSTVNPFGIPPSGQSPPQAPRPTAPSQVPQTISGTSQQSMALGQSQTHNPFQAQLQENRPQIYTASQPQRQNTFPDSQYGPAPGQVPPPSNPYQPQPQLQYNQQPQPQPLVPQQTGRLDKNSILALYNYPQLAPPLVLPSIPEPAENSQPISQAPSSDIFGTPNPAARRSATMPISSMHSAGGSGHRNPFFNTGSSGASSPMRQGSGPGLAARHASAESVSINNLDSGRHSPDAFASLSARYRR